MQAKAEQQPGQQEAPNPLSEGNDAERGGGSAGSDAQGGAEDASLHQTVVYALSAEDQDTKGLGSCLLVTSIGIVLFQCMATAGAFGLTLWSNCESNDMCTTPGTFCGFGARGPGKVSPCAWCGTWAPLDIEFLPDGRTMNFPEDEGNFAGFNPKTAKRVCQNPNQSYAIWPPPGHGLHPNPPAYTCLTYLSETETEPKLCKGATVMGEPAPLYLEYVESWCERCVDPVSGVVDGMNAWLLPAQNVDAMGVAAYLTYYALAVFVALAGASELRDVVVCNAAIDAARGRGALSSNIVSLLRAVGFFRRWVFAPALSWVLFVRIIFRGGHPMTMFENAVGILFLAAIPHVVYRSGFPSIQIVRRRYEAVGLVVLDANATALAKWGQAIHVVAVPIGSLIPLPIIASAIQSNYLKAFVLPFATVLVAGLIEAAWPGWGKQDARSIAADIGIAAAKFLGGVVCFGAFLGLNSV